MGSELSSLGVNVNFAPVCDLLYPETSSAIGDRCLGRDYKAVAERAAAFLKGQNQTPVLGCLKHFPGQGHASEDTHLGPGRIDVDKEVFVKNDLEAFRLTLNHSSMLMMSHCIFPFWDDQPAGFFSYDRPPIY